MLLFADTADTKILAELLETGLIDGVTTNPTLIAKSGRNILEVIKEICGMCDGPISAEVAATDAATMIKEGEKLAKIASNVVIKVPLTIDGLKATKEFSAQGLMTNVTLCFSATQALLAAKAGAGNKRHMLTAKTKQMKRQNRGMFVLDKQDGDTVKQWLPYGLDR